MDIRNDSTKAPKETEMTHDDIFRIIIRIISNTTGIPQNKIFPISNLEKDIVLYEGRGFLDPSSKIWTVIERIEKQFNLDSHTMDPHYRILLDPEFPQKPTVWGMVRIVASQLPIRTKTKNS